MKSIIFIVLMMLTACSSEFSEKKVPGPVIQNFKSRFPNAPKVKWRKEKKWFEAEFKLNGIEVSALYDKKGNLLEIESEVTPDQLPEPVLNSLSKEFPEFKIEDAAKIESDQLLIYEVEIQNKELDKEIFFDSNGKILKEIDGGKNEVK